DDGEMLPPAEFIKAAEKYNRMQAVDRWVIKNVFEWLDDNKENMDEFSGLAINLSGNSMNDSSLLEYIFEMFVDYKVPTGKILFEITETSAITNLDDASDFIREMRSIGCRFALDDFGSGLSSYGYLKHLPVDYVKIDGVFIKDIVCNESDYAMVKSITEMVKFLGMKTVAEYVETDEILGILKDIGVDYAQGYGIEKPVPLNQVLVTGVNLPGSAAL
ncbi:MAG: EAL domain-containing protein, partial [Gammaproteobacteria bacterium]|nr:EAL domain-containing protein [Gammaproteobacteria bacterium]